ncbi:serine hydrolase [Plantactinospora sp. KBS50]|uniref:serine hydrolase n=1 Tax=Plantactinospora sp. KBS50 TaxID=2024580 RepID=UPI000BAAB414|nr:serine hydrolase [Plantactinospora sp. KBS50]ASW53208.1 hypothetical protein CIK06_01965 [Plantactinospora sp. KBS50]
MRPRVIMVLAIVAILLGGVMLVPAAYARFSGGDGPLGLRLAGSAPKPPTPTAPEPASLAYQPVSVTGYKGSFLAWAIMDRDSGEISGSSNISSTNSTESMIKAWLVSDYLRRLGDKEPPASMLKKASTAIRDSDNIAAENLYNAGGRLPVIQRLISICGLTDTKAESSSRHKWAYTQMSPRDAVRMGDCIASGKAAGPKWTEWVLNEMAHVRGTTAAKDQHEQTGGGHWGIVDGLPKSITSEGPVHIKNGWTMLFADYQWHLNCLAVTDKWSLAVMMRYSGKISLQYGASVCASVTSQLVTPEPGAALQVPTPLAKA